MKIDTDETATVPLIRKGACSLCGGAAHELYYRTDWWHNKATYCDGRINGSFVPMVDPL